MSKIKKTALEKSQSVYAPPPERKARELHTIALLVNNEPGVLARVVGIFTGRGYNIESLTVSEIDHDHHLSRITIVVEGRPGVLKQMKAQLERLIPVKLVRDLTTHGDYIDRELALVKVRNCDEAVIEEMGLERDYNAKLIECENKHCIFEITGTAADIDRFVDAIRPLGFVNMARSGVAAISQGAEISDRAK